MGVKSEMIFFFVFFNREMVLDGEGKRGDSRGGIGKE